MKRKIMALMLAFCLCANVSASEILLDAGEEAGTIQAQAETEGNQEPEEVLPIPAEEIPAEPDSEEESGNREEPSPEEEEQEPEPDEGTEAPSLSDEISHTDGEILLPETDAQDEAETDAQDETETVLPEGTGEEPVEMPEENTDPSEEEMSPSEPDGEMSSSPLRTEPEGFDDAYEGTPDEEDSEYGGYEFAGYLEDGTPNFVWEGPGEPSEIGNELILEEPVERIEEQRGETGNEGQGTVTPELSGETGNESAEPHETAAYPEPQSDGEENASPEMPALPEIDPEIPSDPETLPETGMSWFSRTIPLSLRPLFSQDDSLTAETQTLFSSMPEEEGLLPEVSDSPAVRVMTVDPAVTRIEPSVPGNYLKDTEKQSAYHGYTRMSDTVSPMMVDGIHSEEGGRRIYKGGRYFVDGAVALDGVSYYADEEGWLTSGWLKTLSEESAVSPSAVRADDRFVYRYYDPDTNERLTGYQVVDGVGHFFILSTGIMSIDNARMVDGVYLYSDRYGKTDQVKLVYGNTIISKENQNNDAYLAKNMVQAVDINTFTGQDGKYSFRPRWYADKTNVEVFGFTPVEVPHGYYCTLTDYSQKGQIGCIYRNVGRYKGREVDVRLTVMDYEFFSMNGDQEVGYFLVFNNAIGLNACNTRTITADMQFLDHETGQPVVVDGYATFSDIDISQSLTILSDVDEVFVDQNCVLFKDPSSLSFTAPFITSRNGSAVTDKNPEYWVQANYHSDHLTYRFGTAYEQYRFIDGSLINGESRYIWRDGYSGNAADYSIVKEDGNLRQSWQGLYFHRLGRISIPPLYKTVSDADEKSVTENRLVRADEPFEYILSHVVPGESERFYYDSYQITDTISADFRIDPARCRVTDDQDADVSERFVLTVSGQNVNCSAKPEWLARDDFYNNTYHLHIGAAAENPEKFLEYTDKDYEVRNWGEASFTRSTGPEKTKSNETVTRFRVPRVEVIKKDSETGENLKGAEFILYPYDSRTGDYKKEGEKLKYNEEEKKYESEGLLVTEYNDKDGKGSYAFLLKETKPPKGYVDEGFESEIILSGGQSVYVLTVENKPDIPPLGRIIITKRILESDIIWAHGNPTFLFSAEGEDVKGDHHRYEDYLCFSQGGYSVDGSGYAVLTLTIENVPIGTYDIREMPVIDYALVSAAPQTANVTILGGGSASYGMGVLTREETEAGVTFTDKKGDDHGYRHTDVVRNAIPIAFS